MTWIVILHLFGVILGAGGAFASDMMFFSSIRDRKLSKTELGFMKIGSTMVWTGLAILIISGSIIFMSDPDKYMASSKFLLKMTVVGVIFLNGIVFHRTHIPRMHRHADHHLPSSDEFMRSRSFLMASGAISFSSWITAFLLGSVKSIPVSYPVGLAAYIGILICAITGAMVIKSLILPHHKHDKS